MSNKIDKHFMRQAVRPQPEQDEEVWRTSEEGHHFKLETETGEIKAGFGGKLNGQKIDPSKKKGQEEKVASLQRKTQMARGEYYTSGGAQRGEAIRRAVAAGRESRNAQAELERMNGVKPIKPNEAQNIAGSESNPTYGLPKRMSGLTLQKNATQVMGNKTTPEAVNKGINSVMAQIKNVGYGSSFHSFTPKNGHTSTDVFLKNKDGTWSRTYLDNGQEKFTKKGLSEREVGEIVVANAMGLPEDEFKTRYKKSAPGASQSAEKKSGKSNYVIQNNGPVYLNAELKEASKGKTSIGSDDLKKIKPGSNRKFTVIEPVVNSPQGGSPGLYNKRDPYGFRVITGAKMTNGNTPGSMYVFEDNDGNKITFGTLYSDNVDVYEE